ncbi:MAG: heparinase II/III family protein [Planctomycetota bacterium]
MRKHSIDPALYRDQRQFTDTDLFDCLDLDYPPLAAVKSAMRSKSLADAKRELIQHFRERSDPILPDFHTDPHWSDWDGVTVIDRAEAMAKNILFRKDGTPYSVAGGDDDPGGIDWKTAGKDTHEIRRLGTLATVAYAWELSQDAAQKQHIADTFIRWFNAAMEWRPFILVDDFHREEALRFGEPDVNQLAVCYHIYNLGDCFQRMIFRTPGALPDDFVFEFIKQYFFRAVNMSRLLGASWRADNHHLMERGVCLYFLGVVFPELQLSAELAEYGRQTIIRHFDYNLLPDDAGSEHCMDYNYRCLVRYALPLCIALNNHRDLLGPERESRLMNWLTFFVMNCAPDGRLVDTGDGCAPELYRIAEESGSLLNHCIIKGVVQALGQEHPVNPAFQKNWDILPAELPPQLSVVYPYSGHLAMRDGWDANSMFLHTAIKRDSLYNIHSHWNIFEFTLAANGKRLIGNPTAATYTRPQGLTRGFYFSMDAHNTLIIDDDNLKDHRALVRSWGLQPPRIDRAKTALNLNGQFDYASFSHFGYDPLRHRRDILMVRGRYVLMTDVIDMDFRNVNSVFALEGDIRPHLYRQRIHFEKNVSARLGSQDSSVIAKDRDSEAGIFIIPEPFEDLSTVVGDSEYMKALNDPEFSGYAMADIFRETIGACMFSTVYQPFVHEPPEISVRSLTPKTSAFRDDRFHAVRVDHPAGYDIWFIQRESEHYDRRRIDAGDAILETDAAVLFISVIDGRVDNGFVIGGTVCEFNGKPVNVPNHSMTNHFARDSIQ